MQVLKDTAKKSPFVYSAYKFVRDANTVPRARWLRAGQLSDVFRVLPQTMLPMARLFDAADAVTTVNRERIAGSVVECGVWNGGCVGLMALANKRTPGPQRTFHLFDSFEGLPQPSKYDTGPREEYEKRHPGGTLDDGASKLSAIGACTGLRKDDVSRFLVDQLGLEREQFTFHVGWFQDTVPRAEVGDIAILRLDGDWYESTKVCLEGLYDKVVRGGYVIIDDYGTFPGCKRAVDEFFARIGISPDWQKSDQDCVYFRK